MNTPAINFSWNWNSKLFCKFFTTIRVHNPNKYQVGQYYRIQLNERELGYGIIREITQFKLNTFSMKMAALDMGMPLQKAQKTLLTMYKNKGLNWETQQFDFILIEQPEKIMLPFPDELFGRYADAENPEVAK